MNQSIQPLQSSLDLQCGRILAEYKVMQGSAKSITCLKAPGPGMKLAVHAYTSFFTKSRCICKRRPTVMTHRRMNPQPSLLSLFQVHIFTRQSTDNVLDARFRNHGEGYECDCTNSVGRAAIGDDLHVKVITGCASEMDSPCETGRRAGTHTHGKTRRIETLIPQAIQRA